jgi:DNA helicase II / ATP-dependent DNA helicase PcrA
MARTTQQQNFITAIVAAAGSGRSFCLVARAGTGKTHTCMELVDDYRKAHPKAEIALCAFNKSAATEIGDRLKKRGHSDWRATQASTVHALGYSLVKYTFKAVVDEHKVSKLIETQNSSVYAEHRGNILDLVHYAKIEGFGFFPDAQIGDTHAWYQLAEHYDLNGFDDTTHTDTVVAAAQHIYRLSLEKTDTVDFDDQILFPLVKNLRVKFQKDLLIVDEAQDTGRARKALILKFIKHRTGVLVVVGDDRQGIYAFAGAQSDALDQFIRDRKMEVFPLTVCWRCPQSVIRHAQAIVPDIEWAPDAPEGTVSAAEALPEQMEPTDAVLCRNTAPLINAAYSLLRRGVACKVEGREIGSGLLRLVKRWEVATISAFLNKLDGYRAREVQKAQAKGSEQKIAEVNDRCDTLVHLCNVCIDRKQTRVDDLRAFIESMFADNVDTRGVVTLATYHRAKGREWNRVFLIEHAARCPSPWAKQDWQQAQESNLAYVAITRAKQSLTFVG